MIIPVNTALLNAAPKISLNQIIFLSLVLDKNQKNNQDVHRVVSLMQDNEVPYLIDQNLITSIERGDKILYKPTEKLKEVVKPKTDYFNEFYNIYPKYVVRPDGTKGFLRINTNKCRAMFDQITGNNELMSEHLLNCLKFEIDKKISTGKMGYMKTMWRWLVDHTWEESEQEMQDKAELKSAGYGTDLV